MFRSQTHWNPTQRDADVLECLNITALRNSKTPEFRV
jgi:hypothetical protein